MWRRWAGERERERTEESVEKRPGGWRGRSEAESRRRCLQPVRKMLL